MARLFQRMPAGIQAVIDHRGHHAGEPAARTGRRLGLYAIVIAAIAVFLLFSVGIDLWTDALWFQSVGYDSVFWTRVIATLGLGVAAFLVAAVVLLGNIWLAGRLAPPPSAEGAGSLRSIVDRINEAAHHIGKPLKHLTNWRKHYNKKLLRTLVW